MNEINILSIDFDWIMEPCIEFYNDKATQSIALDELLKLSPNIYIKPDYQKFSTLVTYATNIAQTLPNAKNVYFGVNHQEIISAIENIWDIKDKSYHIYNIDHHHDCGYGVTTLQEINKQGLTCGNWLAYCKNLKSYTWINNKNSHIEMPDEVFQKLSKYTFSSDINIINYINFDYIFVCASPGWVPSELSPLYTLLQFNINAVLPEEKERC